MASTCIEIEAPPERVYDVLADPATYPHWLVGAKRIRAADPRFPAPGTSFDHAVGSGPVEIRDSTTALAAERPHRLELEVRARPFGIGRVTFRIEATPTGSMVHFDETATSGPAALVRPFSDRMARVRNAGSLRQLKRYVECLPGGPGTSTA